LTVNIGRGCKVGLGFGQHWQMFDRGRKVVYLIYEESEG